MELAWSRDGREWRRDPAHPIFIPTSDARGAFDWGAVYPYAAPIEVGDEVWVYYQGAGPSRGARPSVVQDFSSWWPLDKNSETLTIATIRLLSSRPDEREGAERLASGARRPGPQQRAAARFPGLSD